MREPLKDRLHLQHIIEAIDHIQTFTMDMDEESFASDLLKKHATLYNILIIGEAIYKLTKEFKESHQAVPWIFIEKLRHILVDDCYQVNSHIMWQVVSEDIPKLKPFIERYLAENTLP